MTRQHLCPRLEASFKETSHGMQSLGAGAQVVGDSTRHWRIKDD
jgi:hypothetical protein